MSGHRTLAAALGAGGIALAALAAATSGSPTPGRPTNDAERLARGEYLVTIGGCHDCHTPGMIYGAPDFGRALAGSEIGWKGPWGITFPRNLTPDRETGLGTWSEDDIVRALRAGMRPDRTRVLPPMPWPNYARLSDADAYAIAAYLKSLPPVEHRVPDRLAPGVPANGPVFTLPTPPPWDAPRRTPAAGEPGTGKE